jgi:hypothetical protein
MARFYAQLCALVFVILAVGGWFLGDASHVVNGQAQGNVDGVALHLTYVRDAVDVVLLLVFIWIGFIADRHTGRIAMFAMGALLTIAGVVGFIIGDSDAGSTSVAGLHFPTAINVFDIVVGVLGILAALGTVEDEPPASIIRG